MSEDIIEIKDGERYIVENQRTPLVDPIRKKALVFSRPPPQFDKIVGSIQSSSGQTMNLTVNRIESMLQKLEFILKRQTYYEVKKNNDLRETDMATVGDEYTLLECFTRRNNKVIGRVTWKSLKDGLKRYLDEKKQMDNEFDKELELQDFKDFYTFGPPRDGSFYKKMAFKYLVDFGKKIFDRECYDDEIRYDNVGEDWYPFYIDDNCTRVSDEGYCCSGDRAQCPICLEKFNEDYPAWTVSPCRHMYHENCWKEWAKSPAYNGKCTVCFRPVDYVDKVWNVKYQPTQNKRRKKSTLIY